MNINYMQIRPPYRVFFGLARTLGLCDEPAQISQPNQHIWWQIQKQIKTYTPGNPQSADNYFWQNMHNTWEAGIADNSTTFQSDILLEFSYRPVYTRHIAFSVYGSQFVERTDTSCLLCYFVKTIWFLDCRQPHAAASLMTTFSVQSSLIS